MAKGKFSEIADKVLTEGFTEVATEVAVVPVSVPEVKSAPAPVKQISFDRWFLGTGRNKRHKFGMMSYTNTNIKRTQESWDEVFKNY